jgi:NACHT domain
VVAKLKPDGLESGSQVTECLEGTRRDILANIHEWMTDLDSPNILWIKGHPGVGKSAIASSLVEELRDSMRLGSNFFFQREKAAVMTPNSLWRTVAYDLARQYPTVRSRLVDVLKEDETILSTVNSDKLFHQLILDPLEASEGIPIGRLPIIVIDALDECGGLEGQKSKDRKSLMGTIKSWSGLPARFKLIVTGRGENDIERLFSNTRHYLLEISAGQMVKEQSSKDITNFLSHQFRQIVAQYPGSLPPDWPGAQTIDQLTNTAAGLFIWADTVTKFVELGEPQEQLGLILNGSGTNNMTALYSCILNTSFTKPSERVKNAFQSIVGLMIFAKAPLSTSSLTRLLSRQSSEMEYIFNGLQSVINRQGNPCVNHQSFVDFLIDPDRCPQDFLIISKRDNKEIALACFRVMKEELRFNICNIESSYLRNVDIPDLRLYAEKSIAPHLAYSAQFWVNHLTEAAFGIDMLGHIQYFMYNQFLFWLEVLSIIKRVNVASSILSLLSAWIQVRFQFR